MSDIVVIEPASGGRISGGYLYNQRMASHGAWRLCSLEHDGRQKLEGDLSQSTLVLADSIWLTEDDSEFLLGLRTRGRRVGVVLHSFPSMIRAAESGAPLVTRPTEFEVSLLEQLGLLVTLGDHYPSMLRGRNIEVVVAPPGVDEAWRQTPHRRQQRCRLVSVGSVTRRKGFLDVAGVLVNRPEADWEWHVVGALDVDPDYARSVRETLGDRPNVHFWGQQPPERTQRLVKDSDVLLMPSYDENHPLALVEAIAACVPVVAYAAGAARDIVGHERCGLVGPIGDVARLEAHLDRVIGDEALRFAFAEACHTRRSDLPSWQKAAAAARERLAGVTWTT